MLLKIYLGISVLTIVLYILQIFSFQNRVKHKYTNKIKEKKNKKKDIHGEVIFWLRLVIVSFIPICNILLLIVIIFKSDEIMIKGEEIVKEKLYKED